METQLNKNATKKNKMYPQQTRSGLGEFHAGPLRAKNMLNEHKSEIFEQAIIAGFNNNLKDQRSNQIKTT